MIITRVFLYYKIIICHQTKNKNFECLGLQIPLMINISILKIFLLFFSKTVHSLLIAETFDERLVFINSTTHEMLFFSLESLVEEYDKKNKQLFLPQSTNELKFINELKYFRNPNTQKFNLDENKNIIVKNTENTSISYVYNSLQRKKESDYLMNIKFGNNIEESSEQQFTIQTMPNTDQIYNISKSMREKIDNIGITEKGQMYIQNDDSIQFLKMNLYEILQKPFIKYNMFISASKRTVNLPFRMNDRSLFIITNVIYVQIMDIFSKYMRIIKFHSVYAPFYQIDRNLQIIYDEIEFCNQKYQIDTPIRHVYTLESFYNSLFFNRLISNHIGVDFHLNIDLRIISLSLFFIQILSTFLLKRKNIQRTKFLFNRKGIKFSEGNFNSRLVMVKTYNENDTRFMNEIEILSLLTEPCFMKYTFREKRGKKVKLVRDINGNHILQNIHIYENIVQSNNIIHVESISNSILKESNDLLENRYDENYSTMKQNIFSTQSSCYEHSELKNSMCFENDLELKSFKFKFETHLQKFHQIVCIFQQLHNLSMAFCNICPENIFEKKNYFYLANFEECFYEGNGISDWQKYCRNPVYNNYDIQIGTEYFRSPEIIQFNRIKKPLNLEKCQKSDVFSLAIIFHLLLFDEHPFSTDSDEIIEDKILHCKYTLSESLKGPSLDLIHHMLKSDYKTRPDISYVVKHPSFWNYEKIYNFYATLSDLLEFKNDVSFKIFSRLERNKNKIFQRVWITKLEQILKEDIESYRIYNFNSVKGLLRVIRNKGRHYKELNIGIKNIFISFPNGFIEYFTLKYPNLLMVCYYSAKIASNDEFLSAFF